MLISVLSECRVICVSLSSTNSVVHEAFCPFLSLSTQLHSHYTLTPSSLHSAPLPYCSGPGRNPHSPVSLPPPPLYSYQAGTLRTERKKEKKKDLHLSVRDYRLPLSTDHVRLPSIGSFLKAQKWERLQGVTSYKL